MFERRLHVSTGERFEVSRSASASGNGWVVLKAVRRDRPDPRSEALLQHEWSVLRRLDVASVARPLGLEHDASGSILVLEDAGPSNLHELLQGKPLDTPRFLELAVPMAETVAEIHRRGLIHRDVCPSNFVLGPHPTLVDFETATSTPAFTQAPDPPTELEGTLAYIAPEQTGRFHRGVDRRADLYALGATFYEMLTGAPPFPVLDPLELLHAHVARRPHAPAIVNGAVPTVLSNIVAKLLSKMPEWRYQSAEALEVDLEEARARLDSRGTIESFELGLHDAPYGLLVSGYLYGRDEPQERLQAALERAASGGTEMVLVAGPSGIGKSAVVQQVRELARVPCTWLEGKGDPLRGNVPFAPILDAVRAFAHKVLREPAERLVLLRERLRSALSPNGRLLADAVPELQRLVGELPPVPEVGPIEAEHRFHATFIAFVRALAQPGSPLVLLLEDLQWVDPASAKLFAAVALEGELRGALLVATRRTEQPSTAHALANTLLRTHDARTPLTIIELEPLDSRAVEALLCEALRIDPPRAAALAKAVTRKTGGNPLAVRRFLAYLYEAGHLLYDPHTGGWSWDLARVEAADVAQNVVELLEASIALLSPRDRDVLATAACVGGVFGLGELAGVRGEPLEDVARALWQPVREGLVAPVSSGPRFRWAGERPVELGRTTAPAYRFVHDRVQEAARRSLEDTAERDQHLAIGRWMLANVPADGLDEAICAIVDHLDRASDRLTQDERVRIAALNERAGRVSRAAAAHASALRYFSTGLDLLPPAPWTAEAHGLWFGLVRGAAESAALCGDHAGCARIAQGALPHTGDALETAELGRVLAVSSALQGAHADAIRHSREALRVLGADVPAPAEATAAAVDELARTRELLRGLSDRQLLEQAPLEDGEERARLRLYSALMGATWFTAPELFTLVSSRAVALTVRRGVGPESPFAFATFAIALAMEGAFEDAERFGRLAVALAARRSDPAQTCRALMVLGAHVGPWRAPLRDSVPLLREAHARGLEAGDLEYAAYASANLLFALWCRGASLDSVLAEADAALSWFRRIGHQGGVAYVAPLVPAARCLKGLTRGVASFDDGTFEESAFLRDAADNGLARAVHHIVRLQTSFLLAAPAVTVSRAREGERWLPHLRTIFLQADHHLYAALALSALYDTAGHDERPRLLAELRGHAERLDAWARHSPSTFGHKRDLVAAELARVELRPEAAALFERSIAGASGEGCVHEEALAHERCASMLRARGSSEAAEAHLRAAVEGYAAWGAVAKVKALAEQHPSATDLMRSPGPGFPGVRPLPGVDLEFLLRASETLTSELRLDRLLEKLMRLCIKASSADRAVLVLDGDEPIVRARAELETVTLERVPLRESAFAPASVVEEALRSATEVLVGDVRRDPRFAEDAYVTRTGVRSVLAVPLRQRGRAMGALYFENHLALDAFAPERVEVFRLLSAQMAIALENSLLFEERHRIERRLTLLSNASVALSETLDFAQAASRVTGVVVPELADWCILDVVEGRALVPAAWRHADPRKEPLVAALRRNAPVSLDSSLPVAQALRARAPLLVPEVTTDFIRAVALDEEHLQGLEALGTRTLLVLPLLAHGRAVGALTLVRCRADWSFDPAERGVAEELARRAAVALENARLHRHQRERSRHLRMIFQQAPGAIWATDAALRLTHVAGQLLDAPALQVGALRGKSIQEVVGTRDPTDPIIARHLAALAGEPQSFPYRYQDRWYELSIEPLRDPDHRIVGCVGAGFDVTEQRATAAHLKDSEARLAEAQRVAHIGSFEWDVPRNVVTWSDELHRIYGLEPGRFAATYEAFVERVHPDDLENTKSVIFDAFRSLRPFEYDHRVVRADGGVRTLHTRGDVVPDAFGKPAKVVGSCWDVTEQQENVRKLEHAVSRWEATLDATAEGILVVDLDGTISAVNHRLLSLWRIPEHAASRREHLRLLEPVLPHLEDASAFVQRIREVYAHPELESFDLVRFADGRLFERQSTPQRIGNEIVGRVWSVRDVTERERLFRRALFLADATRLLASLDVEPALDSVAHLAVPYLGDGCAVDLLGDGEPRRLLAVSRDPTQPMHAELHRSVLAGHPVIYALDQRSYMAVPLLVKGALVGAITFAGAPSRRYTPDDMDLAEDLARRAALSVENARLFRGAQHALQARDEFLSIAAHEIRGPVTSMHMAVQGLLGGKIPAAATSRVLEVIQREDHRLARFVDELLDVGRIRAGRMQFTFEEVDLSEVVRSVTARAASDIARSGSSLSTTVETQCIGHWDRFRLEQVVTNLLSNAIKFGLGKPIGILLRAHDGRVSLVVRDQGIGIAPEMQEAIFLPFERAVAVRHYGGLGLGLFIVRTIVDGLGGTVRVESSPNAGATFTVELPRGWA